MVFFKDASIAEALTRYADSRIERNHMKLVLSFAFWLAVTGLTAVRAAGPLFSHTLAAEMLGEVSSPGYSAKPGSARVSGTAKSGDLTLSLILQCDDVIRLSRFTLRHPVVSLGFFVPGELLNLIHAPGKPWIRISRNALVQPTDTDTKTVIPEKFGMVISPVPGVVSFFMLRKPAGSTLGGHAAFGGDDLQLDLIATVTQERGRPPPDTWFSIYGPAPDGPLVHALSRFTLAHNLSAVSAGVSFAAAPFSIPKAAGSFTLELGLPPFEAAASVSGGTPGYFGYDGKRSPQPLKCSWRISTGELLPLSLFVDHTVEIGSLPLTRIPFRSAGEAITMGFEFDQTAVTVMGNGGLEIATAENGWQELSATVDFAAQLHCRGGNIGLKGDVSRRHDLPAEWKVSVPFEAVMGPLNLKADTTVSFGEGREIETVVTLRGGLANGARCHFACDMKFDLLSGSVTQAGFRLGWQTRG